MSEEIKIDPSLSKEEKYKSLLAQIESLVDGENDSIANAANIIAALKYSMDGFFWVGIYFKKGNDLVVGPFQGPAACTRIAIPNGVCGQCADKRETVVVPDVNKFPGHIACSTESKSEIVTPIFSRGKLTAVLDVDSDKLAHFDDIDKQYLEKVSKIISKVIE